MINQSKVYIAIPRILKITVSNGDFGESGAIVQIDLDGGAIPVSRIYVRDQQDQLQIAALVKSSSELYQRCSAS